MLKDLLDSSGFIAIVTSLFGGAGLAIVSKLLNRGQDKNTKETQFRDEQRQEIESLREQANSAKAEEARLEAEVDKWRDDYYKLLIQKQAVDNELNNKTFQLAETLNDIEKLEKKVAEWKKAYDDLIGPK